MMKEAFKMKILPGNEEEYKKRHDELWPELFKVLKGHGVKDYSIFIDNEGALSAFWTLDESHKVQELPSNPIVKKWWAYMSDIMETNDDNSPKCWPLRCVFDLNGES